MWFNSHPEPLSDRALQSQLWIIGEGRFLVPVGLFKWTWTDSCTEGRLRIILILSAMLMCAAVYWIGIVWTLGFANVRSGLVNSLGVKLLFRWVINRMVTEWPPVLNPV